MKRTTNANDRAPVRQTVSDLRGAAGALDLVTSSGGDAQTGGQTEAERRAERLAQQRLARAEFDTITVGGPRKPAPRSATLSVAQQHQVVQHDQRLEDLHEAPVYRFQVVETFQYDVPNMLPPSAVTTIRTEINPQTGVRRLVPYVAPGAATSTDVYLDANRLPTSTALTVRAEDTVDPDEMLMATIQHATSKRPLIASEFAVAPNDELEISNLHSAEDVISYFSTHGANSSVKFVYLNRTPETLNFRPYDLTVVSRGLQAPEHFVISSSGVVQIKPANPSEVVTLSDWMKESAMFNVLRRIRFFTNYLVFKAFTQWRKNIRLRLYCETRRKLCKRFFLSKATFAATTVDLVKTAYDLTTTPLVHYDPQGRHDYTIEDFNRDQADQRHKAQGEFSSCLEKMENKLTRLSETIQQRANVPDLTTMESLEQYLLANSVASGKDKRHSAKMKSMLEAKEEQYERMRELKRAMVEFSMLDSYIRLVDYVASEAIFRNSLLAITGLYDVVKSQLGENAVKRLGFQILIHPTDEAMVYKPSEVEIVKTYNDMVDDMIGAVNDVSRLMILKPLKVYFTNPPKWWNIRLQFNQDARVIATRHATQTLVHGDYELAQKKMVTYDGNRKWIEFIKKEWPEQREKWKEKKGTLTCMEITRLYNKLGQALDSFKDLIPAHLGHMLYINAGKLKSDLQPKIDKIKEEVDQTLAQTAHKRCATLQNFYKNTIVSLNERPSELKKFADFVALLNRVNSPEEQDRLQTEWREAFDLYELIENKSVEIDDNERGLRDRTLGVGNNQQSSSQSLRQLFEDTADKAREFRNDRLNVMMKDLQDKVVNLNDEAGFVLQVLNEEAYVQKTSETAELMKDLEDVEKRLTRIQNDAAEYTRVGKLFEMPELNWSALDGVVNLFRFRKEVWSLLVMFNERHDRWWETRVSELDVLEMEEQVNQMRKRVFDLKKRLETDSGERILDEVCEHLEKEVAQLKRNMPIITDCGNHHMTKDHWTAVLKNIPTGGAYSDDLSLGALEALNIWDYKDVLAEQSGMATGEANLQKALEEIRAVWTRVEFEVKKYKDDRDVYILDKLDDTIQQLDDHHVQLQTIKASRFVVAVAKQVDDWATRLRTVSDVIDEWITMQKNWMYLEFIFSAEDIKQQLAEESSQFDGVDRFFKGLNHKALHIKNVLAICTEDKVLQTLRDGNKAIDEIQKRLEDYLETKRAAFPRFYFLSNDELLAILSDVTNPRAVQPHLPKCFDSIAALMFNNEAATEIGGMKSGEGEEVPFERVVHPVGNVELWLGQIESMMKASLLMHMRETVDAYSKRVREEWFFEFPAQCIQAADMIFWTSEVEAAVQASSLAQYQVGYQKQIFRTVDLVRGQLSKLHRTLVCTLIVVDVHNRDVVGRLLAENVRSIEDFEWVQQLKYYWESDPSLGGSQNVGIHHTSAHLWYGYEYLGNQPRLVITPLTDRAFLTCTSALSMNLGAAPQGPAGTGKTESVKDLGKALARQVVVFNCSDGINYKTMSRMFAGLAQAGAWACFDEFNRIELEVLSVIAQQMLEICMALGQKLESMEFDGHPIRLSKNFGVFITMNPGYAGRTELPDNLKALFRPICMMIPDYALIAEIMFYSEGFADARSLAQKMVQLYSLASQQLSKQDHYDFGMRAVKSILVMAGGLKRANPEENEEMLLIRAMRDSNVPKFLRDDTVLFMALVRDLFPTVEIQDQENQLLVTYIKADMTANNLQVVSGFLIKTMQLYDTLIVRHGVMMVGQTFCAKTAIVETLQRTLTKLKADNKDPQQAIPLFNTVHSHVLNPKSITMGELYGEVNSITREWTDGILSNIARNVKDEALKNSHRQWILFDGPVDAVWIENMNTVLDDNKMLCLFNGERIKLPGTATFMFEVQDLKVASPATVSRCGMVFVEPHYLDGGWKPVAKSRINSLTASLTPQKFRAARCLDLMEKLLTPLLDFVRTRCREWLPSVDAQLAVSLLELLHGYIATNDKASQEVDEASSMDPSATGDALAGASDPLLVEFKRPVITAKTVPSNYDTLFDMYFIMALIWSVGGNIADSSREAFNEYLWPLLAQMFPSVMPKMGSSALSTAANDPASPTAPGTTGAVGSTLTVFDITIHKPSLSFITWSHIIPDFSYNRSLPYFDLFVPTAETTTLKSIMATLLAVGRNVLVNGVTGVGKSVVVMDFITTTLNADSPQAPWEYFTTVFSAQTKAQDLQDRLESKLNKIKATLLGASPGKRSIFFVDDLNMPALERYGASPPVELLRQLISQRGFFDKKKVPAFFKFIQDVVFVAACGVPGGGRNELTKRLTSKFHLLCQTSVPAPSTRRIFSLILGGFLSAWPVEVRRLSMKLVDATKQVYDRISTEKLPTPAKSHYTFNLRDFGKVIQGMLQVVPSVVTERDGIIRLWIHEVSRVFHDRLIDDVDKRWWWQTVQNVVETEFDIPWESNFEELMFGDYLAKKDKQYSEVADMHVMQDRLVEYQMGYNVEYNKEIELVFFKDAVHHLSKICRICRQPRGNALLVGVGGSGRQSLTRLAAFMCGMQVYQISITRSYRINNFRDDVKSILLKTGCTNTPWVFMLADSQIIQEEFLEDINNLLNTGEVPNLMQPEDQDTIRESVRKYVQEAGKPETNPVMMAHFVQLCRENLHIVLTMSPVGDSFRRRLRMFPSLVNCTTIDWFSRWPADALLSVAARMLDKIQMDESLGTSIAKMCVQIHEDVGELSQEFYQELRRHNYTTPTSYLELLNSYSKMLDEQGVIVGGQVKRLQGGLDKLETTRLQIAEMKVSLTQMQPVLEQSAKETEDIMRQVDKEQKEAENIKIRCRSEEEAATVIKNEADGVRGECQEALDKAMPAYYAAVAALDSLSAKDISEIKAFAKPPDRVKLVLEAVLVLLDERDTSWEKAKVVMSKGSFLSDLREFKKDDIPDRTIRQLQKYIKNEEFTPEVVAKTSQACKSLCLWCRAIDNYYSVGRTIQPKKEQLAAAETKLAAANSALEAARKSLVEVEERVAKLRKRMQENVDRKRQLEDEMKLTEMRLDRAGKLMNGLASEHVRWGESVAKLKVDKVELVGTMLLAAGCVAYMGPFTAPYRRKTIAAWSARCQELQIPCSSSGFSLATIADPVKVRTWGQKGLPLDEFSVENAVISTRSQRWCLCIDPQGQANNWIRNMERDNNLKIIKLSDAGYMRALENAIKVGLPVLLENVEESIDAVIDPVLLRQTYRSQGRLLLKLGDQEVDYEPSFRFYMTTKLPNPHYMPELQIKVTIVNFTVTQKGLEEQLLGDVVRYERADLEKRADTTVVEIADGKAQLKDIEERILSLLASSTGNILDNEVLINTLGEAKKTSESVGQALQIAEATQRDINAARERYRPVATRGSLIYTVITEIGGIDHMYQYSLDFFKRLFLMTLSKTETSENVDKRVGILIPAVTLNSYSTICRGLFEKDKQLFVFLMVSHIFRETGDITPDEWMFFLKGSEGRRFIEAGEGDERFPEWCTEQSWNELCALSKLPGFDDVRNELWATEEEWAKWAVNDHAYKDFPSSTRGLSEWQRLLVLKVFREDLVMYGMTQVVGYYLGKQFTESPAFNLEASFSDSGAASPIIFVLTTGTDPTATFTEFAEKQGFGERKLMLSLGQDQGPKAQEMIATASKSGQWVYLQNCHVYASWMPNLERILEDLTLHEIHPDFRLWLTTMPTPSFPVMVLQNGVKVTKEPPKGLKANMKDSFLQAVTPELWESCKNSVSWKRLLLSLSYFHAIVQERRKFGALGWNIPYEWNQSDFSASIKSLFTYISEYAEVPWDALRYMIGVINYGGRVTDFLDSRCLRTVLGRFFVPEVLAGQYNITDDGLYNIPTDCNQLETVKQYLSNLPPYEVPELFGLHSNADITYNRMSSRKQLDTMLSVQPRSKGGSGMSPDEKVFNIAVEFLNRLGSPIDKDKASPETYRITEAGTMISLGTVAAQETDFFNGLLFKLKRTLGELQRAIKGEVVMDGKLESMYNAFLLAKVPDLWHEGGYLSRKPLASWFEDTLARIEFLRDWNDNGPPSSFWLSGFFFPQGFLTGVLQTHSRAFKIPIDNVKFRTTVMPYATTAEVDEPPETGVYVHGLFMEGARFNRDSMTIDESLPNELFTTLPVVWLEPVPLSETTARTESYSCPVYKTSARAGALSTTGLSTNYVLSLDLEAGKQDPKHWIMRGVALLCMLDD